MHESRRVATRRHIGATIRARGSDAQEGRPRDKVAAVLVQLLLDLENGPFTGGREVLPKLGLGFDYVVLSHSD